jgi:hypothetical protein
MGEAEKPGTSPLTGRVTLLDVLSRTGRPSKTSFFVFSELKKPRAYVLDKEISALKIGRPDQA